MFSKKFIKNGNKKQYQECYKQLIDFDYRILVFSPLWSGFIK